MAEGEMWIAVTGASGGIGKALTARLAAEGYNVIAGVREPARISGTNGGAQIVGVRLDLQKPDTIAAAARETKTIVGGAGLSGLVNMAGIIVEGPLEAIPPAEVRRQLEVNVVGPLAVAQALLPLLKQARGRVINIGAISAHLTIPFYGPIAASKSALAALNDAMRMEFAQFGIKVILIEPGAMKTGIFATSRTMRDATLAAYPVHERHYRPALTEMDRAFAKQGADDPDVVVAAVLHALSEKNPKPRVVVGKGTGGLLMLSRLPIRTRDKLIKRALGLTAPLRPAV